MKMQNLFQLLKTNHKLSISLLIIIILTILLLILTISAIIKYNKRRKEIFKDFENKRRRKILQMKEMEKPKVEEDEKGDKK